MRARLLRDLVEVDAASRELMLVLLMRPPFQDHPITPSVAVEMLAVLFGALTKTKTGGDNAAALLEACADMFNPITHHIGSATGLWEPVSRHPVVLALAIKKLLARSVFAPSPSELREAMIEAHRRIGVLQQYAQRWLDLLDHADQITFQFDRAAWDATYAAASSTDIARVMMGKARYDDFEYDGDDDEAEPPRFTALKIICERKSDACPGHRRREGRRL